MQPPKQKAAQMQAKLDNIDDSECCMCFTTYEEDIQDKTGKEWVPCACGQWLHEDCAELCHFCLDICPKNMQMH